MEAGSSEVERPTGEEGEKDGDCTAKLHVYKIVYVLCECEYLGLAQRGTQKGGKRWGRERERT
jgi:hypothetical protein